MRTRLGAAPFAAPAVVAGAMRGGFVTTSRLSGLGKAAVALGGIMIVLAVVAALAQRITGLGSRRHDGRSDGALGAEPNTGGPGVGALATQVSRALVQADDAVLTSEQELGFAIAIFGERVMAPFSGAVEAARAELREAFRLRQLIDDDPASEAVTRPRLTEIGTRCAEANRLLDEQAEAFDRARDMCGRAPQLVAEVDAHIAQQSARMRQSREVLDRLAAKYTSDAVMAVASNADHATTRLEFAADCLAAADAAVSGGETGRSAVLLQAAEAGADQATDLLTGVLHMEAELTQAASAVPAALREIDAEIAEATALLHGARDDERAALVAQARGVSEEVRAEQAAGAFDSLVALRDLQQADAALDRALAGTRSREARRQRAIAVLDQAMLVARSSVTAAEDFITTRRGSVGATARTRLAEARRHFQQAIGAVQPDPDGALTAAQHADALAQQGRAFAEQEVAGFEADELELSAWDVVTGAGLRGAMLGGILIDGAGADLGPGSFGGVDTRGRHTVSHREYHVTGRHSAADQHSVTGAV